MHIVSFVTEKNMRRGSGKFSIKPHTFIMQTCFDAMHIKLYVRKSMKLLNV